MCKYLYSISFLICCLSATAQKHLESDRNFHYIDKRNCMSSFEKIYMGGYSEEKIKDYLYKNILNLQYTGISIEQINKVESPGGLHLEFIQKFKGVPVYRSQIKVNLDNKGNIISVFDNTYNFKSLLLEDIEYPDSTIVIDYLTNSFPEEKNYQIENFLFSEGNNIIPVMRIEIFDSKNFEKLEILLNSEGTVIYKNNLNSYFKASADSLVKATIFLPDPLTKGQVAYGNPYLDNSDADITELNIQRDTIDMIVTFDNDTFRLISPYAIIKEFSNPSTTPAYQTIPQFYFTRSQQEFEDINAYYHINYFQSYIQSLGFLNLVNYQISIDAHALNGADNSTFIPFSQDSSALMFGEGGVDDAEDPDVIIHEYGHAISNSAAPNTNNGLEREALDEANGDYFASSYSRHLYSYNWENVFSWDGHNEFWPGRQTISTKHYPEDLVYNLYDDADIWSSTLMEIWSDIGRETTDKILLQSMYSYSSNMTMTDAAYLFIQADSLLNNGVNFANIYNRFSTRGILPSANGINSLNSLGTKLISVLNLKEWCEGKADLCIKFKERANGRTKLYNIEGKEILEINFNNSTETSVKTMNLPIGIYFLSIITNNDILQLKLLRF